MGIINVLSFEVANLIAAGEVVDRPASVIKELVENSIDSGATRVTVEIQRGGVLFMRVTDNGCGMTPDDLPVAVRRHATSKIHSASDLDGIATLGFRGEALAAICAVSDVRIISKPAGAALGASIEVNSGRVGPVTEQGASDGTTVIVENLFANVPARLKFLKRDLTEAAAVASVVEKIALSHHEVAFRFISDGTVKLETAGDGSLFTAIRSVWGKDFAARLLRVELEIEGVRAEGYITSPEAPRANRNYQNFFINGRYIKTRTASAALEQAYTSYIPPEKFPGCVLAITISPNVVDVNVHPTKLEVKFSNERPVFDCVYQAARSALLENCVRPGQENGIPAPAPKAGTVSGAFAPVNDRALGGGRNRQLDIGGSAPRKSTDYDRKNADFWQHIPLPGSAGNPAPAKSEPTKAEPAKDPPSAPEKTTARVGIPFAPPAAVPEPKIGLTGKAGKAGELHAAPAVSYPAPPKTVIPPMPGDADAPPAHIDRPPVLPDADVPRAVPKAPAASGTGSWRVIGELFNSYILVERSGENRALMIDKHAAHERLIFEQLRRNLSDADRPTQFLAVPVEVMLMTDEVAAVEQYRAQIEAVGFSFSTARNTVSVSEIPMQIGTDAVGVMFENFADVIKNSTGSVDLSTDIIFEKALYQASCKAAIKAGRVYPEGYVEWLVRELEANPEITYCPHGRPIAIEIDKSAMDHRFKRS